MATFSPEDIPEDIPGGIPPVSYRFLVAFFIGGADPNPLDIAFQKVSGISADIDVTPLREGGQNLYTHKLPNLVKYDNLVLERGMITYPSEWSPLDEEFDVAMNQFKFKPSYVLVMLAGDPVQTATPRAAWVFNGAYPVKWSTSTLDADANSVVIDTLELAYKSFRSLR